MPWSPPKPCNYRSNPPCSALTTARFCEAHAIEFEKQRQAAIDSGRNGTERRRKYNRKSWKDLRTMVLAAEPLCRDCNKRGFIVAATHVDHVQAIAEGGDDSFANLQPLCHGCHSRKTVKADGGFGRGRTGDGGALDSVTRAPSVVPLGKGGGMQKS